MCYIKLIFNYLQVDWKNGNIKVRSIFKEFLNLSKIDRTFASLDIVKTRNVIPHSHYSLWYRGYKHLDSRLLLRMPE